MIEQLLDDAFAKIGLQTGNETKNGRAVHLEEVIKEDYKTSITARSLVRYMKKETSPRLEVRNALAKFLGFEHYEDYVTKSLKKNLFERGNRQDTLANNLLPKLNRGLRNLWMAFIAMLVSFAYLGFVKEGKNCMIWIEDHYERCSCTGRALEFELNETELENFRKVAVCDTTLFFKQNEPRIWYDRFNGTIEYFTYYGKNPRNGRTLKVITQNMVDKHVPSCY